MDEGLDERIAMRRAFLLNRVNIETTSKSDRFRAPVSFDASKISTVIDHTALKPDTTSDDVGKLCQEAIEYNFMAVCVNGMWAPKAFSIIEKSPVLLCCVVGFPLGASCTKVKAIETQLALEAGADEIDMVLPIGKLKEGDFEYVFNDILAVVQAASKQKSLRGNEILVKVILETCLLSESEIIDAAILSVLAGAHYVKTSTGFSDGGATLEAVNVMKMVVGNDAGVKASGGVRTLESARMYLEAGASRIGTSSGIGIVMEARSSIPAAESPPIRSTSLLY
jgi:deoxyribose-phosphate aldolase